MLSRFRISTRLYGVLVLLILILGALGVLFSSTMNGVISERETATDALNLVQDLKDLEIGHLDWVLGLANSLNVQEPFTGQLDHTRCALGQWYYPFLNSSVFQNMNPSLQAALNDLEKPHEQLHGSAREIMQLLQENHFSLAAWGQAQRLYDDETTLFLSTVREKISRIENLLVAEAEQLEHSANQTAQRGQLLTIIVIIIAVLIGTLVGGTTVRSVCRTLRQTVARVEDLASGEGDLTQRLAVDSEDELGVLANNLNSFIARLQEMMQEINRSTTDTVSETTNVAGTVQQLSSSVEEVAGITNQFAGTVQNMSDNSQNLANLASTTMEQTTTGATQIERTVRLMEEINHSMIGLGQDILLLEEQSDQIRQIVDLITDIAEQTNLLALNAAIEAARAGEEGRGFAVVAGEVRVLAEQSAGAAQEIARVITKIRQVVDTTADNSRENAARVEEGRQAVQQSGTMYGEIDATVHKLARGIQELAASGEELSAGSQEIAASSEEQSASIQEIGAAMENVAAMAEHLQQLVGEFSV